MQPRALGSKVSDEWTVPLCALHHRELHDAGDERKWWRARNIDAPAVAREFWQSRQNGRGCPETTAAQTAPASEATDGTAPGQA
jgi:hypothetical protein